MTSSLKNNSILSRLRNVITLQRNYKPGPGEKRVMEQGQIDKSKWKRLNSGSLGISQSMIPDYLWIVLKVLRREGYEAYLVGGCVRDLILKRVPKDFDVITTAALKQVKQHFHRAIIVGVRFPICRVQVRGSVIEVSSFDTVAKHNVEKESVPIPCGCDIKDYSRWKNCMLRDFTINSLFFDPFESKIYDYANAMMDLRSLKLRTLIPAHKSFEEDCARILRGLRLAARLGLSLSRETEIAIQRLVPSIASLPQSRLLMEMNYMFSYGASAPSLSLLQNFKLLEILLPLQAAYLNQQSQNHRSSVMLMNLFNNLDQLVTCDRPSDSNLWVGLLAFHMALIINPQDALVVWTFASVLYHGNWEEAVKFGREHAQKPTSFVPEISHTNPLISDNQLVVRVAQLASAVQHYTSCLSHSDNLVQLMSKFPDSSTSRLVFVPYKTQRRAYDLFNVLCHNIESYVRERKCSNIDYKLLGQGNIYETRFALGKIIIDTMRSGSVQGSRDEEKHKLVSFGSKNDDTKEKHELLSSVFENETKVFGNKNSKRPSHFVESQKDTKKKKLNLENSCVSQKDTKKKKLNLENSCVSEDVRNKAADTDFDTLAKLKLHLIEKNKKGIRNMLEFEKDGEHPKIENVKQQHSSEAKLKPVKKTKVVFVVERTSVPLDNDKKQEKVPENDDGKSEIPGEDVNTDTHLSSMLGGIENVQQQDMSKEKMKLVQENFQKANSSMGKTNKPLGRIKKCQNISENYGCGEGVTLKHLAKTKKPEKGSENKGGGGGKTENIENVKRKDSSDAKLKPVKKIVKEDVILVKKTNALLDKNKKREKVSEKEDEPGKIETVKPQDSSQSETKLVTKKKKKKKKKKVASPNETINSPLEKNKEQENNGGGEGKTEKPEQDENNDTHQQISLSSTLEFVKDHPKVKYVEPQGRSQVKLKPVKKKVEKVNNSIDNNNLPLDKIKKQENNGSGGSGNTDKSKEDVNMDKHQRPSLYSMFRR